MRLAAEIVGIDLEISPPQGLEVLTVGREREAQPNQRERPMRNMRSN
jgi:hypothetical protein